MSLLRLPLIKRTRTRSVTGSAFGISQRHFPAGSMMSRCRRNYATLLCSRLRQVFLRGFDRLIFRACGPVCRRSSSEQKRRRLSAAALLPSAAGLQSKLFSLDARAGDTSAPNALATPLRAKSGLFCPSNTSPARKQIAAFLVSVATPIERRKFARFGCDSKRVSLM